jgi:hypothetical protein
MAFCRSGVPSKLPSAKRFVPSRIHHREMGVEPVAGIVLVGLGHEGGGEAVVAREAAHELLEEPGVVRGLERVRGRGRG